MSEVTHETADPSPVVATLLSDVSPTYLTRFRGRLGPNEEWWRNQAGWLTEHGYQLRPRYRPDWTPSWEGTKKRFWKCEDGLPNLYSQFIDAVRIKDGAMVALKKVVVAKFPEEIAISQYFTQEPLAAEKDNHCVPVIEVLNLPDGETALLVLPLLRAFDSPPFVTIGEVLDFCGQICEGLDFMHRHNVAHRDCHSGNIMMDPKPLYPDMFHPLSPDMNRMLTRKAKQFTRMERPVKYYFIDFGISGRYPSRDGVSVPIHIGGDRTVPEFQASNETHHPFPTDVYYVGNLFREEFLQKYKGLDFLKPLVDDMVQENPAARPSASTVKDHFRTILGERPLQTPSKRLARKGELFGCVRDLRHSFRIWTIRVQQSPFWRRRRKS